MTQPVHRAYTKNAMPPAISQMLTLFTTPVVYIYLDRVRWWASRRHRESQPLPPASPDISPAH